MSLTRANNLDPIGSLFENNVLNGAEAQFDRCITGHPLATINSKREGITQEEIAEYRCKQHAC